MSCCLGKPPNGAKRAGEATSPAFRSFGKFSRYTLGDCAQLNSLGDTPV